MLYPVAQIDSATANGLNTVGRWSGVVFGLLVAFGIMVGQTPVAASCGDYLMPLGSGGHQEVSHTDESGMPTSPVSQPCDGPSCQQSPAGPISHTVATPDFSRRDNGSSLNPWSANSHATPPAVLRPFPTADCSDYETLRSRLLRPPRATRLLGLC